MISWLKNGREAVNKAMNSRPIIRVAGIARAALKWLRFRVNVIVTSIIVFLVASLFFLYALPALQEITIGRGSAGGAIAESVNGELIAKQKVGLEREIVTLKRKQAALTASYPYLVINTSNNTFRLYVNRRMVREGVCSTGSYVLLRTGDQKQWYFETPKGLFRVQTKTTNPVWKKPDWAFVEEGLPVPPEGHHSRFEYGVLGDYALGLGDGYLIHGTLFQRFLGLPVTHGCVRMNDADLEMVYNTLVIGSKVYMY